MADLAKLVDELSALTVLEAAELSKMLEEKWGVSAAAPVAAAAAPAAHTTLEGLKCSARLSLRRWACGRIGEWLGDGNGPAESLRNLLGDLLRARVRRVGDGNDAHLE